MKNTKQKKKKSKAKPEVKKQSLIVPFYHVLSEPNQIYSSSFIVPDVGKELNSLLFLLRLLLLIELFSKLKLYQMH